MKKLLTSASTEDRNKLRNKYTKACRKAKQIHEQKLASSMKGGVWDALKRKTRSSSGDTWDIEIDGVSTTDCSKIATAFKDSFVSKISRLRSPAAPAELLNATPKVTDQWDFHACTEADIARIVDRLKISNASGPDLISSQLIKETKFEILPSLVILVNRCLQEGYFPECFKTGKVVPVPKKGSLRKVSNYRPITITSVVGKIVECAANEQLSKAVDHHLPNTLFGFRKGMGTADAIIAITDAIKERRANGEFVAALFCNASCAFDLLDHGLTLSMLERLGAGPRALKFIQSFLSGSKQYVLVKDSLSEEWSLDVGSGQGHVLSPPLYNIGTLSQYYWCVFSTFFGYADDGSDIVSASTIEECNAKIKQVLADRLEWYRLSGLAINVEKTTLMGFGFQPAPVHVDNIVINPVNSTKFLGFMLQSDLGLDQQVKSISDKIRVAASKIRGDGNHFHLSDRRRLYMGWVQGALCSNGSAYLPLLSQAQASMLQTSCNSAIRSVAKLPRKSYDISITNVRKNLNILSVENIADKLILTHAWKERAKYQQTKPTGPTTRSRSQGNIPQPNQKGMLGKMIATNSRCAFNKLPLEVKLDNNPRRVKKNILKIVNVVNS